MNPKYFWEELSDVLDTEPNIPPVIPIIEFNVRPLGILPVTLNPILVTRDMSGKTTDKVSVVKRLIKFLQEYDYTLADIAKATDLYINTLKSQGSIKFIRECGYFISKKIDGVEQSDLAKWCEELKNGSGPAYNSHQIL